MTTSTKKKTKKPIKKANCLSLNGGGSKGLISLHQVEYLYESLGQDEFYNHFDYIGGTSTGALMTALLARCYTPSAIIDIYKNELPSIFSKGCLRQIRGLSKYSNSHLKGLAYDLIGDITLGEMTQKILIPAVDTTNRRTIIFKSYDPKYANYKLVDVIIASAAAPTFFPAHKIGETWYKDGGLAANNPSDMLLAECQDKKLGFDEVNILSITTGVSEDTVKKSEIKGGLLSVPDMINEVLYLQDLKTHGIVSKQYKNGITKGTYERCDSRIFHSSGDIDGVSKSNIKAMIKDGVTSVDFNKKKIDNFVKNTI
jgi:patatin-like phospholipase/acyl hydrolase